MISVIMPLYNNEKYVIEAIQSVINQTYKDWELIIINDASTDNSKFVVQNFLEKEKDNRLIFIDLKENKGVSFARNLGMRKAKGEYISFLDSDDFWDKEFLKLSYLKLKENYKFVYTNFGCVVIEKSLLEIYKINFPEKQFLFEDVLFFAELLCITKSGFVENTMAYYRQHKESKTHEKYTSEYYLQELIYLNELINFIDKILKRKISSNMKKVIYYRTYRIIWFIIKSGDIDRGIYLINKYKNRLKKFGNIKEFKWNDRLKCKMFLLNNKFLLSLLKNI